MKTNGLKWKLFYERNCIHQWTETLLKFIKIQENESSLNNNTCNISFLVTYYSGVRQWLFHTWPQQQIPSLSSMLATMIGASLHGNGFCEWRSADIYKQQSHMCYRWRLCSCSVEGNVTHYTTSQELVWNKTQ